MTIICSLELGDLEGAGGMSETENTLGSRFFIRVQQNKTKLMLILHFFNPLSGAEHKDKTKVE